MRINGLWDSIKLGVLQLVSRPIYLISMFIIPIGVAFLLLDLMDAGLPEHVPSAVVDLDHTDLSRTVTRTLNTMQTVDIQHKFNSYTEADDAMKRGEIFGFYIIPTNFAQDALAGRQPQISYYSNMAFYVPASIAYKGFKTVSVLTAGGVAQATLSAAGVPPSEIATTLQPILSDIHPLGNPWMNYNIYLSNSFVPATLALMIMLLTVFSLGIEIKRNTSKKCLETANGSIIVALIGKLLPQTIIFSVVGIFLQSLLFGYFHFPMNGNMWEMIWAMVLLVIASQSFAVIAFGLTPNLRLALSACSLIGILSFSIAAFSYPVDSMYGSIGIFSYILPIRYYFLIYIQNALNGNPLYYSRIYFAALLIFPLIAFTLFGRIKKAYANPVYIP